jgi:hypothetical protein
MAASKARLEALLARVQQRASEPRTPSVAVAPILEAVNVIGAGKGGAARSSAEAATVDAGSRAASAASAEAPPSVRAVAARSGAHNVAAPVAAQSAAARELLAPGAVAQNEIGDDDIEEYDDELIEIIDDAEVIPQAAAVARAIEPAAFGAAVDRRPSSPIRSEAVAARPASTRSASTRSAPAPEALRPEAVGPRPIASTEVVRARNPRRELRHTSFVELLDASLGLG